MIVFTKKDHKGDVVASNNSPDILFTNSKQKNFYTSTGILALSTDEEDLLKSAKIFKKVGDYCAIAFDLFYQHFISNIQAQSHTLSNIQGKLVQKIESIVPHALLSSSNSYLDQKRALIETINNEPDQVAESILYLQRRIFELGSHISSFEILHMGKDIDLDFYHHNIKKIIINIWHAFDDALTPLGITNDIRFDDEYSEENKLSLDYKTINAALYNFFDNVTKYALPYNKVRFLFKIDERKKSFELIISMRSLRIEREEIEKVFELNYRGVNCRQESGSGVGMYVFKKALELNKLKVVLDPDYSDMREHDGRQYILNKFYVVGTLSNKP